VILSAQALFKSFLLTDMSEVILNSVPKEKKKRILTSVVQRIGVEKLFVEPVN
jgi:hypothetical protein